MNSLLPLKARVIYDGRVQIIDRRPDQGLEMEKLPDRIWHTIGMVMSRRTPAVPRRAKIK